MAKNRDPVAGRWARLRFAIVGPLLASPPPRGALRREIARLAQRRWTHPVTGDAVAFAASTIERWYYAARAARRDPVSALARRRRRDRGRPRAMSSALAATLAAQYEAHPSWSKQVHFDNLKERTTADPALGPMPSYATLSRFMRAQGWTRQPRGRAANAPRPRHEVRSYEVSAFAGLWHADFHQCSRRVALRSGAWAKPRLFLALDDRARLSCHAQWYLRENARNYAHGLWQAFLKHGLPRALMSDRGGAELAGEIQAGLAELGVLLRPTASYSPYQNGKCERLWLRIEEEVIAQLEGVDDLTLDMLNQYTLAWLENVYHRQPNREMGCSPLERLRTSDSVVRISPPMAELEAAFRIDATRTPRRGDATISVDGVRFELPIAWRSLTKARIRYARWDLSRVELVDAEGASLALLRPLDRQANADRRRRPLAASATEPSSPALDGPSPVLRRVLAEFAATGLPPAYLPLEEEDPE